MVIPAVNASGNLRREHDMLGERDIPAAAYWGVHTLRALENFRLSGETVGSYPDLVAALANIKLAAARSNRKLGLIQRPVAEAIASACEMVASGDFDDQFPVSIVQGGAGTSTNMNANEVIANLALEHLGHDKGEYFVVHPNEHVNLGQSTNDVYPTALKLATIRSCQRLVTELNTLRLACDRKGVEFADIVKMGRTQLQDAVPMTLGQEFRGYAVTIREEIARLREAMVHLHEINLGGTAIGTGLNAHPQFAELVRSHLEEITGLPLRTSVDLVEATQDCGVFVLISATVKRAALKLSKISNDLRLLSSGPRAGFHEITLPARQAGSSIMPGKVNPVIPEMVSQIAYEIVGFDMTISMAAEGGQLQLNAFEPVIAASLFRGLAHLAEAARCLAVDCIDGITPNVGVMAAHVAHSIGTVTALSPYLGYEASAQVAMEALETGRPIADIVLERALIDPLLLEQLLAPTALASGGRTLAMPRRRPRSVVAPKV